MKNKWSKYALKDGKVQSSYIREYCNRKKVRKTGEASSCNSNEQSREEQPKIQEEVEVKNESIREKESFETHQEGRQGISKSNQGRRETQETNYEIQDGEKEMKEKVTKKEKKHEAKETKAYEKKEDKKEARKESKPKKK